MTETKVPVAKQAGMLWQQRWLWRATLAKINRQWSEDDGNEGYHGKTGGDGMAAKLVVGSNSRATQEGTIIRTI